ncbi:hypothetical protein OEA41_003602 [Lepraria neglecta]|uniref:Uncharacterized protein n=1 Tax=Lepraria neglecta TaxID=209136 RepID=A0AAD9Z8Q2_9LECA|nr:hypothetical protein OEA41_003602 [Lepraria neglecta]
MSDAPQQPSSNASPRTNLPTLHVSSNFSLPSNYLPQCTDDLAWLQPGTLNASNYDTPCTEALNILAGVKPTDHIPREFLARNAEGITGFPAVRTPRKYTYGSK